MKISKIEVDFPLDVEMTDKEQQELNALVSRICSRNVKAGRVMWPAGCGQKPIDMDRGLWEEKTFYIEVYEREASPAELERMKETH